MSLQKRSNLGLQNEKSTSRQKLRKLLIKSSQQIKSQRNLYMSIKLLRSQSKESKKSKSRSLLLKMLRNLLRKSKRRLLRSRSYRINQYIKMWLLMIKTLSKQIRIRSIRWRSKHCRILYTSQSSNSLLSIKNIKIWRISYNSCNIIKKIQTLKILRLWIRKKIMDYDNNFSSYTISIMIHSETFICKNMSMNYNSHNKNHIQVKKLLYLLI